MRSKSSGGEKQDEQEASTNYITEACKDNEGQTYKEIKKKKKFLRIGDGNGTYQMTLTS